MKQTRQPLLSLRGVRKSFGNKAVLQGVDLHVDDGEILGLTGHNGAGKTTLANIIAGAVAPDDGTMSLRGQPHAPPTEHHGWKAGVGVIKQHLELDPALCVEEAILPHMPPGPDRALKARGHLIEAGLALALDQSVGTLSRAERGLLELLRLRADETLSLIVMDEVSATFNAREVEDLRFVARQIADSGRGVIHISHRRSEMHDLCDRVLVLRDGTVLRVREEEPAKADARPTPGPNRSRRPSKGPIALEVAELVSSRLNGLSFTVREGEVVSVVGDRASGVHDILAALSGGRPAQTRRLELFGEGCTITSPRDAVSLGVAHLGEDDTSAARSLLIEGLPSADDFDDEVDAVADILATLRSFDHAAPGAASSRLSGGQQRLRVLAEVLSLPASLILLQEPTRGLDARAIDEFTRLLERATRSGAAVLVESTDHASMLRYSDRVLVVEDGGLLADWNAEETSPEALDEIVRSGYFGRG